MKRLLLTGVALLCLSYIAAQTTGIDFRHDLKWEQAVDEARKENKLIFVDFYTQWCGPCFNMSRTVFVLPDVAYFYNNNFINMKIDCEDPNEGEAIAKKYGVRVYPTYGFIDPKNQELVHVSTSRQSPERFIQTGRDALTPETRSFYIEKQYESGNRERKFLGDYIRYNASIYKHDNVRKAFDELIEGGAKLSDDDAWGLFNEHITGMSKYLKEVSDNYGAFCEKFGKDVVDAKLSAETKYGDPDEIAALCDFDGKDFNLKLIDIEGKLQDKDYAAAGEGLDAMIADPKVDRQKLIDRMKFIIRLNYRSEELPDAWFSKCVGYLRFIAYNNSDRDEADVHQAYADALEKLISRKSASTESVTSTPTVGKTVYNMRPDGLKQKPVKK